MSQSAPVIITPGDPAGIGPEIALKAVCSDEKLRQNAVLMGDETQLSELAEAYRLPITFKSWSPGQPLSGNAVHLYHLTWPATVIAGTPDARNAPLIINAIETAVQLVQDNKASAIVTCPIAKSVLYEAGFTHPGHTEFLGALSRSGNTPIMMLANDELKVVPATIHIPLIQVSDTLSISYLTSLFTAVGQSLQQDFGIANPHIAVCGVNPHAGENGAIGVEEQQIIIPAIEAFHQDGNKHINISGPYAADSLFHPEKRRQFDCVIGMYHDQVLIPVKTIDFHGSTNITIGLDFVRTSPDHGTAFDIAGQNKAHPDSLINAIKMAQDMSFHRNMKR